MKIVGEPIGKHKHIVISDILSLEENLADYAEHRRLSVFNAHGCECANPNCDRVGTRLIETYNSKGNAHHVDVYTEDYVLMTVDHMVPKSLGGSEDISNKMVLCQPCNSYKSNYFIGLEGFIDPSKRIVRNNKNGSDFSLTKAERKVFRKQRKVVRTWSRVVPMVTFAPVQLHMLQYPLLTPSLLNTMRRRILNISIDDKME